MPAHLTILPPRDLRVTEQSALEFLEETCSQVVPFEVELGGVSTFLPTTPTIFIEVKRIVDRMSELHDQLCGKELSCAECWPYVPHLTILKTELDEQARTISVLAAERWAQFRGKRHVRIEELSFVRESNGLWRDVAPIPLGRGQLSSKS
jgi:2'-5' RNA ligase